LFNHTSSYAEALEAMIPLRAIAKIASAAMRKRTDTTATRHAPATLRTPNPRSPRHVATTIPPSDDVDIAQSDDVTARMRSSIPISLAWRERIPRVAIDDTGVVGSLNGDLEHLPRGFVVSDVHLS
jgi:hypothetical protein